jgi:hypothetical protein
MGQYFRAPKLRESLGWHYKLGEVLFDGTPSELVHMFAKPTVRPTSGEKSHGDEEGRSLCAK